MVSQAGPTKQHNNTSLSYAHSDKCNGIVLACWQPTVAHIHTRQSSGIFPHLRAPAKKPRRSSVAKSAPRPAAPHAPKLRQSAAGWCAGCDSHGSGEADGPASGGGRTVAGLSNVSSRALPPPTNVLRTPTPSPVPPRARASSQSAAAWTPCRRRVAARPRRPHAPLTRWCRRGAPAALAAAPPAHPRHRRVGSAAEPRRPLAPESDEPRRPKRAVVL